MNTIKCDCLVIGGGAAGMMAAITASGNNSKVIIAEHTKRIGSKILQTGNGKCNFTNLLMDENKFQNDDKEFVKKVLSKFGVSDTLAFFKKIGVYYKEKNGYVYPNSETAASLQNALRLEVMHKGVEVLNEFNINKCTLSKDGKCFDITASDMTIKAKTVIIATGSKAAPKTGSDGSGYGLAKQLGHTIVKPLPALVQLISDDRLCKTMAGVRSTGKVTLYINDKEIIHEHGEIQYTDYGISGIPVFQISRYAVKAVDLNKKVYTTIDMLPVYSYEELVSDTKKRMKYESYKTIEEYFSGLLNKKLVAAVAKRAKCDINAKMSNVKFEKVLEIIELMKDFRVDITGFKSFENAQVCQGGVSLDEINPETMESKLHKGLYFAGEVVDVDGKCGGYNLQWAWSSAYLAGNSAKHKINERGRNVKN